MTVRIRYDDFGPNDELEEKIMSAVGKRAERGQRNWNEDGSTRRWLFFDFDAGESTAGILERVQKLAVAEAKELKVVCFDTN